MKKLLTVFIAVILIFSFAGCGDNRNEMTLNDFEALILKQPVTVTETELLIQNGNPGDKNFYPDMLTATVQNRTNKTLCEVRVAFVAWDKNGEPVKIKPAADDKEYDVKSVIYKDLSLESGRYYGKGMGINLAADHNIASFKAIVFSFKTTDGESWVNPYYEIFKDAFVSQKFSKSIMFAFKEKEETFKTLTQAELEKTVLDEAALNEKLAALPVKVLNSEYIVFGADKDLTPDAVKTTFTNTGKDEISAVTLGFFAFDEEGKAVKIIEAGDNASKGNYLAVVQYKTDGFVKDSVFGENDLFTVHEKCKIKYAVAVVKAYTLKDGKTIENPYFIDACLIYEGKEIVIEAPELPEGNEENTEITE